MRGRAENLSADARHRARRKEWKDAHERGMTAMLGMVLTIIRRYDGNSDSAVERELRSCFGADAIKRAEAAVKEVENA